MLYGTYRKHSVLSAHFDVWENKCTLRIWDAFGTADNPMHDLLSLRPSEQQTDQNGLEGDVHPREIGDERLFPRDEKRIQRAL